MQSRQYKSVNKKIVSVRIKSGKGKWFWYPGKSESIGEHMSEKDFGKQDL